MFFRSKSFRCKKKRIRYRKLGSQELFNSFNLHTRSICILLTQKQFKMICKSESSFTKIIFWMLVSRVVGNHLKDTGLTGRLKVSTGTCKFAAVAKLIWVTVIRLRHHRNCICPISCQKNKRGLYCISDCRLHFIKCFRLFPKDSLKVFSLQLL